MKEGCPVNEDELSIPQCLPTPPPRHPKTTFYISELDSRFYVNVCMHACIQLLDGRMDGWLAGRMDGGREAGREAGRERWMDGACIMGQNFFRPNTSNTRNKNTSAYSDNQYKHKKHEDHTAVVSM